jgi:hypothetical protein
LVYFKKGGKMIKKIRNFKVSGDLNKILKDLDELEKFDKIVEKKIKISGWTIAISLIAIFFTLIYQSVTGNSFLLIFIPIFLITFIVSIIIRFSYEGKNLENRRIEIASNFLRKISEDIPEKAQIFLEINFDGYLKHGKKFEISNNRKNYRDLWFILKGKLQDGNSFKIKILQLVKRKEKPKPKYTKVRERIQEVISVVLRINKKIYPKLENNSEFLELLQKAQLDQLNLEDNKLRISKRGGLYERVILRSGPQERGKENLVNHQSLLNLFLNIYSALAKCR